MSYCPISWRHVSCPPHSLSKGWLWPQEGVSCSGPGLAWARGWEKLRGTRQTVLPMGQDKTDRLPGNSRKANRGRTVVRARSGARHLSENRVWPLPPGGPPSRQAKLLHPAPHPHAHSAFELWGAQSPRVPLHRTLTAQKKYSQEVGGGSSPVHASLTRPGVGSEGPKQGALTLKPAEAPCG